VLRLEIRRLRQVVAIARRRLGQREAPFGRFILVDPRLVRAPVHFPVGCALPVSSLTRAKSTILASSHVRPPSLDHDSS